VYVIAGAIVGLGGGRPNVRLVWLNAPETGGRALRSRTQKSEAAGQRLRVFGQPD
jgi:hypothetical protein